MSQILRFIEPSYGDCMGSSLKKPLMHSPIMSMTESKALKIPAVITTQTPKVGKIIARNTLR